MFFLKYHNYMDSSIGLPITIVAAVIISSVLFWCTYRHQVEPTGGRQSEAQLNAIYAAEIQREIELEGQPSSKKNDEKNMIFDTDISNCKITLDNLTLY